ncbi:HCLS1-binding protein 3-like [Lineus longissimus]|uniref:HCLS1-binding protein 3-like n=1 Tax=Lineus longissimus TaxID=88925 RepID=UPI002B4DB069
MPKATVTVRELKNKDTGIDVSIPTYQEIIGLISNTVEFQVVIVTVLRCFKSPEQKDDDVVQFMIKKKPNELEELHAKLNKKYSATVLPPLPKKTLFSDLTFQELRAGFEHFLQFLSVTPKLCSCPIFTEFLGVDHAKAEKLTEGDDRSPSSPEDIEDIFEEHQPRRMSDAKPTEKSTSKPNKPDIFGEDNADDDLDLFTAEAAAKDDDDLDLLALAAAADERAGKGKVKEEDVKIVKPTAVSETKLFDDQDYGGGIDREEADKIFYIPSSEPSEKDSAPLFEVEDNSELLNIEDDLDKLLTAELPSCKKAKPVITVKPHTSSKPDPPDKPTYAPKPVAKPVLPPKPGKPALKPKPGAKPKVTPSGDADDLFSNNSKKSENLDADDIMKYIQDNADDTEVDLFS